MTDNARDYRPNQAGVAQRSAPYGATLAVAATLLVGACTPESQDIIARESARSVVIPALEQRYPGVPAAPVANCVIDNANASEIVDLAAAGLVQDVGTAARISVGILQRPAAFECAVREGLAAGLLR